MNIYNILTVEAAPDSAHHTGISQSREVSCHADITLHDEQHRLGSPVESCPICSDDLDSEIVQLSCGHKFDNACIMMWFQRRADQDETINCPLCRRVPIYACGHEVYDLDVQDLTSEDLEFQCKICSPLSYACGHFVHGDEYPTLRMTTLSMPCWACAPTMKMREHNQSMGIHPLCATISRDPGYYDWASFLWSTAVAFDELGLQADKIGPDRFKRSQMQSIADSLGTQDFKSDHFKSMINTVTLLWKTYTWVQDHDEHRCNELGYTLVAGDKNTLARVQQKWLTDLKKATDAIYYFPVES